MKILSLTRFGELFHACLNAISKSSTSGRQVRFLREGLLVMALLAITPTIDAQQIVVGPFLQKAQPTSIWIVWETDTGSQSAVDYGITAGLGQSVTGTSFLSAGGTRMHQVQLTNLIPDTRYYYQVRTNAALSQILDLRTPPQPTVEQAFRFAALSDTQGNGGAPAKHTEIINDGVIAFVQNEFGTNLADELAFVVHAGDLVSTGSNYAQWKTQFFDEAQNLYQHVPLYPAIGNHEQNSQNYFDYFILPTNGTPGFLEHWYYTDYMNVRIIAMDTNGGYRIQAQLDWLDSVLASAASNNSIDFVFAHFHHPHHSEMWTPGNTPYVADIITRMEQFSTTTGKPSVHFFGHTHAYSRGQSRDHKHLMVNVAAGEGGLDYWGNPTPVDYPEYQRSFIDWGFMILEVQAGADPQFRMRRISRGNDIVPKNNEVMDDVLIRRFNQSPDQPSAVAPVSSGAVVNPDGVTLTASPFSDPDGGTLLEAHYQLSTISGDYSNPAVDEWTRIENWFSPAGASGSGNGYFSVNTVTDPDITSLDIGFLDASTTYYWRVRYRDDGLAWSDWSDEASFITQQRRDIVLLEEDFDDLDLGLPVDESSWESSNVWTNIPPAGWSIDNSGVPSIGIPEEGVAEWEGWSFAVPECWTNVAGDQNRSQFTKASGIMAVADPDEWDDKGNPEALGPYNSILETPSIDISQVSAGSLELIFDSSWRPEDSQTANITVSYDGNTPIEVMRWESFGGLFKPDATNETVTLALQNPGSADSVIIRFGMLNAANDWWWAIDNLVLEGNVGGNVQTVFSEDFDGLLLDPAIDENFGSCTTTLGNRVWSETPPAGWTLDDSGVPGVGTGNDGVTEWVGWAFTDPAWWTFVAADQQRSAFTKASDTIAVADPDEWDDLPHDSGTYNAFMTTAPISLGHIIPGSLRIRFDSSWRPEDNQKAALEIQYDGSTPIELLRWESQAGDYFKPDATNETLMLEVDHPIDALQGRLIFSVFDAGNDWWWAIDNLEVTGTICSDPSADFDGDTDVDLGDYAFMQSCYTLALTGDSDGACFCADMDGNLAVDETDLETFLLCASGSRIIADPSCDD